MKRSVLATILVSGVTFFAGCKEEQAAGPGTGPAAPTPSPATTPAAAGDAGDHPNAVDLGEKSVAGLKLKARQDGPVAPGPTGPARHGPECRRTQRAGWGA